MQRILEQKLDFYKQITTGEKKWIHEELHHQQIEILTGFIKNIEMVRAFYRTYYKNSNTNRIVLCGINPGRFGAGKTGVPFLDFKSLSNLIPNVKKDDSEGSAQFVFKVISNIGPTYFFDQVYLTNISWFGFLKNNNNLNYYELDERLQKEFLSGFAEEMRIVKPHIIIPLSLEVEKSLHSMNLEYKIGKRLQHPNYCKFPSRIDEGIKCYLDMIRSA